MHKDATLKESSTDYLEHNGLAYQVRALCLTTPEPTNMRQSCLCQYLRIECNHPDTLLQLPVSIRERIYLYAGLVTGRRLNYGEWPDDVHDTDVLMDICPQVYREVEALLLEHNTWVLTEDNIDNTLPSLWGRRPESCARLRDLHIHIRGTSRHYWDPPLRWKLIQTWQGAARHVLQHATPGQLRLHVVCDVDDNMDMAKAVVAPFDQFPGRLRELELCLSSILIQDLGDLAREVAVRAQVPDEEEARPLDHPFPFFKLPFEIRRHIFLYTDLVLPHRKVLWVPDGRGFRAQYYFCDCDGTVCREKDLHCDIEFSCCDAEFCSRCHSSYSKHCQHKTVLSLLLASRAMYQEALAIFYASNKIIIAARVHPEHGISMWDPVHGPPPSREERQIDPEYDVEETYSAEQITHDPTRLFIEYVGTAALRYLRDVEIVLPRTTTKSSLENTTPVYTEWCEAVDLFAEHCTLPGLTISIHIFTTRRYLRWPLSRTEEIRQTQSLRMLCPLKKLSQLNRLFVLLEWPRHWSSPRPRLDIDTSGLPITPSPGCGIGEHFIPSPDPLLVKEEMQLERYVMGDQYDSFAAGKRDLLPSPWLRHDWDNPQT